MSATLLNTTFVTIENGGQQSLHHQDHIHDWLIIAHRAFTAHVCLLQELWMDNTTMLCFPPQTLCCFKAFL